MSTPVIEIVVVGNEILAGKTADRNAPFMIETLAGRGFGVSFVSVVGDDLHAAADSLAVAAARADLVLVTGGLGPTSDDITFEAAARAFGRDLVFHEDVLERIRALFEKRGRFMSGSNRRQAMLPEGSLVLENPMGTAPAVRLLAPGNAAAGTRRETEAYFMPGVPREMRAIFTDVIMPRVLERYEPPRIDTATVSLTGISESELFDGVKDLPGAAEALAFYPHYSGIEVRIATRDLAPAGAVELRDRICAMFGDRVFSTAGEPLEEALGRILIERDLTIAVAESCTGGLISHRLTNIPGSSAYFLLGVTAYANEAKIEILGVGEAVIAGHGAVSAETVKAMAEGVRRRAGSDIGVSTTGIAGPGGGSAEKPVGLMFMGLSAGDETVTKKLQFVEDRLINKNRMAQSVLDEVRRFIVNNEFKRFGNQ